MIKKIKPIIRIIKLEADIHRLTNEQEGGKRDVFGLQERCIPLLDVLELEDEMKIQMELPGVQPRDISIFLQSNAVEIKGKKNEEPTKGEVKFLRLEREYGRFRRYVSLPSRVNMSTAKAVLENGILTIKAKKSKQKGISIKNPQDQK